MGLFLIYAGPEVELEVIVVTLSLKGSAQGFDFRTRAFSKTGLDWKCGRCPDGG
ncbi:MAG: hypothetical protein AAGM04_10865 [Pseudomonadota bacterium]